jgi:hypothetical protein
LNARLRTPKDLRDAFGFLGGNLMKRITPLVAAVTLLGLYAAAASAQALND